MNNIIDPQNGNTYSIFSQNGKNLLKKYVNLYQTGGSNQYKNASRTPEEDYITLEELFETLDSNLPELGKQRRNEYNTDQEMRTRQMIATIKKDLNIEDKIQNLELVTFDEPKKPKSKSKSNPKPKPKPKSKSKSKPNPKPSIKKRPSGSPK